MVDESAFDDVMKFRVPGLVDDCNGEAGYLNPRLLRFQLSHDKY